MANEATPRRPVASRSADARRKLASLASASRSGTAISCPGTTFVVMALRSVAREFVFGQPLGKRNRLAEGRIADRAVQGVDQQDGLLVGVEADSLLRRRGKGDVELPPKDVRVRRLALQATGELPLNRALCNDSAGRRYDPHVAERSRCHLVGAGDRLECQSDLPAI